MAYTPAQINRLKHIALRCTIFSYLRKYFCLQNLPLSSKVIESRGDKEAEGFVRYHCALSWPSSFAMLLEFESYQFDAEILTVSS